MANANTIECAGWKNLTKARLKNKQVVDASILFTAIIMKKLLSDLEYEFDVEKNYPLRFSQVTPGRRNPVVWTCVKCEYSWSTAVSNRLKGTACPRCTGRIAVPGKTDLASTFPEVSQQWDYSKNEKMPTEYLPYSNQSVFWICENGHQWKEKINNRTINALACPYCTGARPIPGVNDLSSLYPWLVTQWDQKENGTLSPSDVFPKSNKRVAWVCARGHTWKTKIYHRTEGQGCPYCAGVKPIVGETDLQTLEPTISQQWNAEKNRGKLPSDFTCFSHFGAIWICDKGHEYSMPIYRRAQGRGCPVCNGKSIVPGENDLASRAPEIAEEWDDEKNGDVYPSQVAPHSNKTYFWRCKACGHTWTASPNNRIAGRGCPKCSGCCVVPDINSFAAMNPILAKQWDLERNKPLSAWDVAAYDNRDYYWKCDNGHIWQASPANRSKGTRCPFCIGKIPVIGTNDLARLCPTLVERWDISKNKKLPETYFPDSTTYVWWKCLDGHSFRAPIREMALRWHCPECEAKKNAPWRK